jgi:site-specific DNA recombinase
MENGHEIPVALYERVSTQKQADEGYSLEGMFHELRQRLSQDGRRVVTEVSDRDEKRWTLHRPGVERLRELAASGEVEEIWAWAWDRYGESPWPEVLSIELEEHGVALRALDDGGEGEDAELLRALKSQLAKREQTNRVRRSRMGMFSKARGGEVLGASPYPRYGFEYVRNEKGKAVGYVGAARHDEGRGDHPPHARGRREHQGREALP